MSKLCLWCFLDIVGDDREMVADEGGMISLFYREIVEKMGKELV